MEDGKLEEICTLEVSEENILYINKNKVYYLNTSNSISSINLETKQEENTNLNSNTKFIGNSAYEIEENTNIKIINLSTNEEKKI